MREPLAATGQPRPSIGASDSNLMTDSDMLSQKNDADYGVGAQWVQRMSIKNADDNYHKDFAREQRKDRQQSVSQKGTAPIGEPPIHKTITFDNIDESMGNNEQIQVQPAVQQAPAPVHPFLAAQGNKIKGQVDENFKNEMKRRAEEIKLKEQAMREALEKNLKNMFQNKL